MLTCPSCNAQIPANAPKCAACEYGYDLLHDYYGGQNNRIETTRLTDSTQTLRKSELKAIQSTIDRFSVTLPDLFFAVYLESKKETPTTKGLWLHNNITFTDLPNTATSQYGFLLYIDPMLDTAALSYGIGLSPYVSLEESNNILRSAIPLLSQGNFPKAIRMIIHYTSELLISKCPS